MELLAGGSSMPVTPQNVYEYVRRYAEHRMLVVAEQPLHVSADLQCVPAADITDPRVATYYCWQKLNVKNLPGFPGADQ